MKIFSRCSQARLGWALGLALTALVSQPVQALVQDITAEFRPDPTNPASNKFVNTTPETGICPWHIPAKCKQLNMFSIRVPFTAASNAPIQAFHTDPRKGVMFQLPSAWRDVDLQHESGEIHRLQMRIAGVGGRWNLERPPGVSAWTIPGANWDQQWRQAPSPCIGSGYIAAWINYALFFWIVPENATICARYPGFDIPWLNFSMLEFAYELKTPNPLKMPDGIYTGQLNYSMGPGKDFDFGDVIIPTEDVFTFNFKVSVDHILKVEIPPGGRRVELQPQGGWQAWLNHGRKPARLFQDQTFNLYASSAFKMQMECEFPMGNTCGIRDAVSGESVPLQVAVTLPFGLTNGAGQAVNRQPLRLDGAGTERFDPSQYVDRKPGTLHFEVRREDVEGMLRPGESRTYSGAVTVIWDSQV